MLTNRLYSNVSVAQEPLRFEKLQLSSKMVTSHDVKIVYEFLVRDMVCYNGVAFTHHDIYSMKDLFDNSREKIAALQIIRDSIRRKLPVMIQELQMIPEKIALYLRNMLLDETYLHDIVCYKFRTVQAGSIVNRQDVKVSVDFGAKDSFTMSAAHGEVYINPDRLSDRSLFKFKGHRIACAEDPVLEKIGAYGYLPANFTEEGIFIEKCNCPRPLKSPKSDDNYVFCRWDGSGIEDQTKCPGFGGYSESLVLCKYLDKKTS